VNGRSLIYLLLALFACDAAAAQGLPPGRGETVRLLVRDQALRGNTTVVGTYDGVSRDSLYLTDRAYARSLVRRVEVARGKTDYLISGIAFGAALGGLSGALLGVSEEHAAPSTTRDRSTWGEKGLIGAVVGAVAGAALGSLLRRTRWERVRLKVTGGADPSEIGLSYALPLR
jgi:hypothetical protein